MAVHPGSMGNVKPQILKALVDYGLAVTSKGPAAPLLDQPKGFGAGWQGFYVQQFNLSDFCVQQPL